MSDTKTQLATFRIEPDLLEEFKSQARRNGKPHQTRLPILYKTMWRLGMHLQQRSQQN
jgi:uncharacterized protein (DUF4415 family)